MRFSIDINSSVPGSLWDGFVGIEVVRDERELVAVSEIKDCLLKSGEARWKKTKLLIVEWMLSD